MLGVAASLALFGVAGCGLGSKDSETAETKAPQTVVVVSEVPAPTAAPTDPPATLPPTTQPPQTVVVVQGPQQAPQTVVRVIDRGGSSGGSTSGAVSIPTYVEPGDYCGWLADNGYTFSQAEATYYSLGSPDHMDADHNGVPCETRY